MENELWIWVLEDMFCRIKWDTMQALSAKGNITMRRLSSDGYGLLKFPGTETLLHWTMRLIQSLKMGQNMCVTPSQYVWVNLLLVGPSSLKHHKQHKWSEWLQGRAVWVCGSPSMFLWQRSPTVKDQKVPHSTPIMLCFNWFFECQRVFVIVLIWNVLLHPLCLQNYSNSLINVNCLPMAFPVLPMLQFTLEYPDKSLLLLLISVKQKNTVKKAADIKMHFFCLGSLQPW